MSMELSFFTMPLAQTPGPDLAWQDVVMENEAFISSENSCISTSRRARAGWHAWIWFRTPDPIVSTNQDNVHVLSHLPIPSRSRDGEGRPHKDESVGRFKPAPSIDVSISKSYPNIFEKY
jgi:hypothetical protein